MRAEYGESIYLNKTALVIDENVCFCFHVKTKEKLDSYPRKPNLLKQCLSSP